MSRGALAIDAAAPTGIGARLRFAALALLLMAATFAGLTHGMAAAPGCAAMLAGEIQPDGDSADEAGPQDRAASPDGAHCGFGMTASARPGISRRDPGATRLPRPAADLLAGRERRPDQRPPDRTAI